MKRNFKSIILLILFTSLLPLASNGIERAPRISDRELIEILTQLREGQKSIIRKLEEQREWIDRRFKDQQDSMDRRFTEQQESIEKSDRKVDKVEVLLDAKIDKVDSDLKSFLLWGFGVLFFGMFFMIGFILWDRRTIISPTLDRIEKLEKKTSRVEEKGQLLEEKERKLENALKEFAKTTPELANILAKQGLG